MKRRVGILKTEEGLIQLRQCPKCLYLVKEADIVWKRKPIDFDDQGEVASCRFCHEGDL